MSFTTEVKSEIAQNELRDCCAKAELSALIQLSSTLSISNQKLFLSIQTENATTAKRALKMVKDMYKVETELSVMKKMKLKKNNVYIIRILNKAKEILEDLELYSPMGLNEHPSMKLVSKDCCARAYLAGCFLSMGSVNAPQRANYHLEVTTNSVSHAAFIQKLMLRFDLPAKLIVRRNQNIVYLKAADKISDFLRCIGAFEALMQFEDIRITRDFKNSLTRLDNCEVANEMKSQAAGKKQVEEIEYLMSLGKFEMLDDKLTEVARLRLRYPEASLNELSDEYEKETGVIMSKSGMKHRFTKLKEIADKYHEAE